MTGKDDVALSMRAGAALNGEGAPKGAHTIDHAAKQVDTDDTPRQYRPGDGYLIEAELRLGEAYRRLAEVVCGDNAPSIVLCDTIGDLVDAAAGDIQRAARLRGPRAALGALRKGRSA